MFYSYLAGFILFLFRLRFLLFLFISPKFHFRMSRVTLLASFYFYFDFLSFYISFNFNYVLFQIFQSYFVGFIKFLFQLCFLLPLFLTSMFYFQVFIFHIVFILTSTSLSCFFFYFLNLYFQNFLRYFVDFMLFIF